MAFRCYRVPVVIGVKNSRRPKYFDDGTRPSLQALPWTAMDYGFEPIMIVGADCSGADDAFLVAQPDVAAFPFDLNPNLTAPQVTNTQTQLEAANLPAGWVNTTLTWRQVLRTILGMFEYLQRYGAMYAQQNGSAAPSLFGGGVTLDTTFGSLPVLVQTAMTQAATSLGFSTAGLTSATPMRAILKNLADNFQGRIYFNGQV